MPKTNASKIESLPLDAIRTHPRLQPRGELSFSYVQRYARMIRDGKEFPAIRLGRVGKALYVVDGHHRLAATAAVGIPTISATVQRYRTLDDAHRAALLCNHEHGKQLSSKEKEHALRSYIDHGLHFYGPDEMDGPPGAMKSLRVIARECPVYTFQNVGKKLKQWGIHASRGDTKPFAADYGQEWDGPSEDEIAEDDLIALKTLEDHLAGAQEAWAVLSPASRDTGLQAFQSALRAIQSPQETNPNPLSI